MSKAAASIAAVVMFALLSAACDDGKKPSADAPAASAAAASATAAATTTAPAASAHSGSDTAASTKDPNVAVKDPVAEPSKEIKAQIGSTVTLYLPKWAGTSWTVKDFEKPLGKAKEETIPGFAGPSTPAAGFAWKLNAPTLKPGQKLHTTLENKSATDKAATPKSFTLTIELVPAAT